MADESGTTSNKLKALSGVTAVALVGVVGVGAVIGSNSSADSLEPTARDALNAAGLDAVEVEFSGREATLSGGSASDLKRARSVVEDVEGVRWAKFDSKEGDGQGAATFKLERDGSTTRISGVVPDDSTAKRLKQAAEDTFDGKVIDDLTIDASVETPTWSDTLPNAIRDLATVKDLELEASDSAVDIGGEIESKVGRDKVLKVVSGALGDVTVNDDLEIDPGSLSARDAAIINGQTLYFRPGSDRLTAKSAAKLDRLARVLSRNPDVDLTVGGYAEPGTGTYGTRVSQRRVNAVVQYLAGAGIERSRLQGKSYGADRQTDSNPRSQKYRRVEFVVKEK